MPQEKSNKVTVSDESLNIRGKRVGEAILQHDKDLWLANGSGIIFEGPAETTLYGLLLGKPLFLKWIPRPRRPWIARLEMKPKNNDKRWLLEVFGKEHLERFKELAEVLSIKFSAEIHVRLESESPQKESFDRDFF